MIILAELVFYCSPVVLLHGTSSHVMPTRAGATAGIYGCGQPVVQQPCHANAERCGGGHLWLLPFISVLLS